MFIGHFGLALAAKKLAPRTSLGTLLFATQFADLIWPILLLLGIEHVRIAPGITRMTPLDFYDYPISHSLLALAVCSAVVGGAYYLFARYAAGAWVVALGIVSHWFLDVLMHRADMPLWPGGPRIGIGLWNSWTAGIAVEILTFTVGIWIYRDLTRPKDAVGRYAVWGLMTLVLVVWIGSLVSGPPPSEMMVAWGALSMWIAVPWGWWGDKHRAIRGA
jgi:membrane-bound metal-dependent hydrolase YbcI (DUF457 family)